MIDVTQYVYLSIQLAPVEEISYLLLEAMD
jgi:hypothetical protein